MEPDSIFFYGTLLPELVSFPRSGITRHLRSIGRGTVQGRLYDLGPYPAAVLDGTEDQTIHGEVFALPADPSVLAALDDYEGVDPADPERSLYARRRTQATLTDGRVLNCWVYEYLRDLGSAILIPDGDYARWRLNRSRGR